MTTMSSVYSPRMLAAVILTALVSGPTFAQQEPLTGTMMSHRDSSPTAQHPPATIIPSGTAAPVLSDSSTAAPMATDENFSGAEVGDVTRHLLGMQVSGSQSGTPLPMLGDEASASYRRYLKSFEHPIPEFYKTTVGKNGDNGR
jgi:hypothetical protein